MQMDSGMLLKKRVDGLGLVGGEIVDDDMDVPATGLCGDDVLQEVHKRGAGVARHRLANDFTGGRVERGVQQLDAPFGADAMPSSQPEKMAGRFKCRPCQF